VARLGGDEFVILQPGTTAAGASHLAGRILRELAQPIDLTFGQVEISGSIGITMVSDPQTAPSDVLRQADLALYAAKEAGRNTTAFFEPEMDAALRLRRALEGDLRHARQRRNPYGLSAADRSRRPRGQRRGAGALASPRERADLSHRADPAGRGKRSGSRAW
jgi:predicted signal transduction protein with EAL and GGDEF domain